MNETHSILDSTEVRTCFQIFQQHLDIFGRPTKKFYQQLAEFASNKAERDKLLWIIGPDGKEEFKERVDETITYADLLQEFTSAKLTVEQMIQIIPPIKPRCVDHPFPKTVFSTFLLTFVLDTTLSLLQ